MSGHSFWLIERGQAQQQEPTLWWEGQSGDWTQHKWTHKAIEAFRFPTREAAQAEIDKYESRRIGIGNLTVELGVPTEHVILPVETRGPDSRTQFSSCCARCGKPADIEVGPVNDVLNVHLVPQCDCIHVTYPSGFNLWWPITTTRNVRNVWTWRNDAEVQRQCELFYAKIREMVGDVDDLPTLYGVIDAAAAAALASRRAAPKPWGWAITLRSELGSWNEAVGTEEEAMIGRLYPANSQHGEARVVARARLYAGEVENADSTSAHSSRFGNDGSVVQLHGSVSRETTDAVGPTDKGVAESAPGAAPEREPTREQVEKLPHRRMAEVEIADAIVRLLDYSAARGYDLDGAMREKLAYNAKREDHKKESANIAQKNPLEFESVFDVALTAQSEAK